MWNLCPRKKSFFWENWILSRCCCEKIYRLTASTTASKPFFAALYLSRYPERWSSIFSAWWTDEITHEKSLLGLSSTNLSISSILLPDAKVRPSGKGSESIITFFWCPFQHWEISSINKLFFFIFRRQPREHCDFDVVFGKKMLFRLKIKASDATFANTKFLAVHAALILSMQCGWECNIQQCKNHS